MSELTELFLYVEHVFPGPEALFPARVANSQPTQGTSLRQATRSTDP